MEEIPIPLLSCLSVCGYRALTLDDSPLPHTLTLRVGVRGVSVLCSLRVCLSGCVCVCVCVCVSHSLPLTHSHSLTPTHSLPLISHSLPLSSYLTSFSLTFYSHYICVQCTCVSVCVGLSPVGHNHTHSLTLAHSHSLSFTLTHSHSLTPLLSHPLTLTPTPSLTPLTCTLCVRVWCVCVCAECVCVWALSPLLLSVPPPVQVVV